MRLREGHAWGKNHSMGQKPQHGAIHRAMHASLSRFLKIVPEFFVIFFTCEKLSLQMKHAKIVVSIF